MAALPAYVTVLFSDLSEGFDPEVISSPMERGLPKLRQGNSRVVVHVPVRLRTFTQADSLAFDDWYFDTIKRIGWFDWFDTRARVTRSVRFKGGALGDVVPLQIGFETADRTATLEYLR
jgi:hypothetical protein